MKKLLIILLSFVCLTSFAARKSRTGIDDATKDQIAKATPTKLKATAEKTRNVLVFSNTAGYNHGQAIASFEHFAKTLQANTGDAFNFVISNDFSNFEKDKLATFDAVVLSNTTGRIFTLARTAQGNMSKEDKAAMETKHDELLNNLIEYVENGGGLMGIHGACDSNKDSAAFVNMMGGMFMNHPWTCGAQDTVIIVEDPTNPLVGDIWPNGEFISRDEIYQVTDGYDRTKQRVLCALDFDRSPIVGNLSLKMKKVHRTDNDFGLVWVKTYGKGRVAYIAFGHDATGFVIPEMLELYTRGMQFVAGDLKVDTTPIAKPAK